MRKSILKIKIDTRYLFAFIIILAIETSIAIFLKDGFIRNYLGDVLVVVLIYCFIKIFVRNKTVFLPLCVFIFAVMIEIGQYFNLVELLGLSDFAIARIIIGTSFDIMDIVCYLVGCIGLFLFELTLQ
ncbi:MAG: DUF2809 domain-containing protein [Peptococcaceae bacterium]|nr:DUF2809 domain-containing protein [Peptococcaceae bacterium]